MKLNLEQIIAELEILQESFNAERDACPLCIIEAIKILKALRTIKEV